MALIQLLVLLFLIVLNGAVYEQDEEINLSRRQLGHDRLEEYKRYAQSSLCWRNALSDLGTSCKTLSDTQQSRLALAFANCHFERSGRNRYECSIDQDIKDCTNSDVMDDTSFQVYTEFFTHTGHLCYFIQNQLWQENAENTINQLTYTSSETVKKLEVSLEYHRRLDDKQTKTLENQDIILEQENQIASSLKETHSNIDKAFQEMFEKTESQKLMLNDLFDSLSKSIGGIQWILSAILGEIMSLETAAFFIAAFLIVTFLPQFGFSRVWLYFTLIVYGLIEGGVRRCVLWLINPQSQDAMISLHTVLWYTRWTAAISLGLIYFWRYLVHSNIHSRQLKLLEKVQQQVDNIHNAVYPPSPNVEQPNDTSSFIAEETDTYCCPFHEQIQPDSEVIALDELYNKQNHILSNNNSDGYLLTGTQLLDFLSGLYVKQQIDTIEDSDSDSTYLPPTTTTTTTTTIDTMDLSRLPINQLPVTSTPQYIPEKEINIEKVINTQRHKDTPPPMPLKKRKKERSTQTPDFDDEGFDDSGISIISHYNLRPRKNKD